jgi:Family of unknown function (DUF6510)
MDGLDGNAIAGLLVEVFGVEMTAATATCSACTSTFRVAELAVFLAAPATVARCPRCDNALMVFLARGGIVCVGLGGLAALEPAAA